LISQTTTDRPAPERTRAAWRAGSVRTSDGFAIATFEAGRTDDAAPVIVCVHGMGHWTQAAWDFVAARFEATHRVVAFDLPGFGASEKPRIAYTLDFFERVLGEVIEARAPDARVVLMGHSLGGLIAARYASQQPERVALLVLVDPAGFLRTPSLVLKVAGSKPVRALVARIRPSAAFVRRTFRNAVFDPATIPEDYLARAVELSRDRAVIFAFADVYANAMGAFIRLRDLHARLARYNGPTLLVWGRDDRFVPVRGLATARRVYPGAHERVIDACGHCPAIEHPAILAAAMRDALSKAVPATA